MLEWPTTRHVPLLSFELSLHRIFFVLRKLAMMYIVIFLSRYLLPFRSRRPLFFLG